MVFLGLALRKEGQSRVKRALAFSFTKGILYVDPDVPGSGNFNYDAREIHAVVESYKIPFGKRSYWDGKGYSAVGMKQIQNYQK